MKKFKKYGLALVIGLTMATSAQAWSFKRFISNPFNVSINSVLNPFHTVYKLNTALGYNPTTGIPKVAFTFENEEYFRNKNQWRWDTDNQDVFWKRRIDVDNTDPNSRGNSPFTPPDVVVTPPCNRGGPGITPC